jgi:hypothetical protein
MSKEQPDFDTKCRTILGEETGWTYVFSVPPGPTAAWTPADWITFIGDKWYRTTPELQADIILWDALPLHGET